MDAGIDTAPAAQFAGYIDTSLGGFSSKFFDEATRTAHPMELSQIELWVRHEHDVPGVALGTCGASPRPVIDPPRSASAGTLTIRSGAQPLGTFPPAETPDTGGPYYGGHLTLPADASLDLELSGAVVPAFSLPMLLRTPSQMQVTAPPPPTDPLAQPIPLAPSTALTISWTPPQTGRVSIIVNDVIKVGTGSTPMYERRQTFCVPDTASGTFTIPAAVFDAGATSEETEVVVKVSETNEVTIGSSRYVSVASDWFAYYIQRP